MAAVESAVELEQVNLYEEVNGGQNGLIGRLADNVIIIWRNRKEVMDLTTSEIPCTHFQ